MIGRWGVQDRRGELVVVGLGGEGEVVPRVGSSLQAMKSLV